MSLQHFYLHDQVLADEGAPSFPLRLSPDDAKHARVLRLAPGEHIAVVDAAQDYFECEIAAFDDAVPVVRIAQRLDDEERPLVMLVQGLAKGDKMETVIRHATELGVSAFVPMSCERSIVRLDAKKAAARTQRWRAIAKSAAMQSGQRACPEVGEPMALADVCASLAHATAVLVCWEEALLDARFEKALERGLRLDRALPENARIAVVVGPEGGLSRSEADALLACNPRASLVSLGSSILRTETAGIVAPALVLHELGRMMHDAREAQERTSAHVESRREEAGDACEAGGQS